MKMQEVTRDLRVGECDRCHTQVECWRGHDATQCPSCGANYNCFGQRLRDDLHTRVNPSEYDENIGDLEGDEISWARMGEDY